MMSDSPGSKVEAAKTIIMKGVEKALTSIYSHHSEGGRKYSLRSQSGTSIQQFYYLLIRTCSGFDVDSSVSCQGAGIPD